MRFAADLKWLADQGVTVERFDPARQPDAFVGTPAVLEAVARRPNGPLPVILVNGRCAHQGSYPSRRDLAAWAGVADGPPSPAVLWRSSGCAPGSGCCG
ncbi:MAG TPA: arsenic metallochaperone ArsD family protein [Thermoanaerobaculia bacterium]|nr:arsenic metallochaperone ArsD family protein [Thermoanaerobaculia bacterium]